MNIFSKMILFVSLLTAHFSYAGGGLQGATTLSVMTYNLENLFDTLHDKGKEDYTYLPLKFKNTSREVQDYCLSLDNDYYRESCFNYDWSDSVLQRKMQNLSQVILSYNNGAGADIIVFQEVENIRVLKQLVSGYLSKKGYRYIALEEGKDKRGIDVGMISKYPIRSQRIHHINISKYSSRHTRPILEVKLQVNKKTVTIFGNHWPSQGNVDEARIEASKVLRDMAMTSSSNLVIATGDFNTSSDDVLNGIELNVLPYFIDVEAKARELKSNLNEGTHWYRGAWESLDKIFVLKKSLQSTKVQVDYLSYEILKKEFMLIPKIWIDYDNGTQTEFMIPNRYDTKTGKGFSDHLPVAAKFILF